MGTIRRIRIDPKLGMVVLEFGSFDDRAEFWEKYVPGGDVFGKTRCNKRDDNSGPPRLSWKLSDFQAMFVLQEQSPTPTPSTRKD